jgi:hypothetical protein
MLYAKHMAFQKTFMSAFLLVRTVNFKGNIDIKHHSSRSIKRDAGVPESALRSLGQSICRSCVNDIRVGQAKRLHQYPINSDIHSGHAKDPRVPYASRELWDQEGYQS